MAEQYQKVLQLYRSTNIWNTKNKAKAEVEIHAKQLHGEITAMLRDGEPIIAKYYDFGTVSEGYRYKFTYETPGSQTDPYSVSTSATHVWLEGFDSFKSNEFDSSTGKIKGIEPNYDSPAYIRVGESGRYTYYTLKIGFESSGFPEYDVRNESAVFGVALIHDRTTEQGTVKDYFIEWFDSAAEAKGAISELNYNDKDLSQGFVAKVNQKDGKIEAIHGNITGENATVVTDNHYDYKEINSSVIPDDYIWISGTNEGSALPQIIDESSPKYYHNTTSNKYYELRKNIEVTLSISDPNNVLKQGYAYTKITESMVVGTPTSYTAEQGVPTADANSPAYIKVGDGPDYTYYHKVGEGLSTNMVLRELKGTEVTSLGTNVREAYRLFGNANGNEVALGDIIKVYKDSSLIKAYLGHVDDSVDATTGVITPGVGNDALCFVYKLADETYTIVTIDIESFLSENEFHDGLEVITGNYHYDDYEDTPDVPVSYWVSGTTEFASKAAAETAYSTVTSLSPAYLRYGTDPDWNYLIKEGTGNEVQVKLATDGGIDFKTETVGNKSLKIKIDTTDTNSYYEQLPDSTGASHRYEPGNSNADAYGYVTIAQATSGATGYYKKDTYLHTTSDGLAVDQDVLKNKITDNISKVLYVNGQQFIKDTNGDIKAVVNGEQITVAGASSTGEVEMTTITPVEGTPVTYATNPTASANTPDLIYNSTDNYLYKKANSAYSRLTVTSNPAYIEVNGLIYKYDGSTGYKLFFIDKDTNLNDATAILNYLTYNLDMGQFTIQ